MALESTGHPLSHPAWAPYALPSILRSPQGLQAFEHFLFSLEEDQGAVFSAAWAEI